MRLRVPNLCGGSELAKSLRRFRTCVACLVTSTHCFVCGATPATTGLNWQGNTTGHIARALCGRHATLGRKAREQPALATDPRSMIDAPTEAARPPPGPEAVDAAAGEVGEHGSSSSSSSPPSLEPSSRRRRGAPDAWRAPPDVRRKRQPARGQRGSGGPSWDGAVGASVGGSDRREARASMGRSVCGSLGRSVRCLGGRAIGPPGGHWVGERGGPSSGGPRGRSIDGTSPVPC